MRNVLLDTGPLVAFLNRRDHFHEWATEQWDQITPPLLTCEAVLAESCFLLRKVSEGGQAVMELVKRGVVIIPFRMDKEIVPVTKLLVRYVNIPISLADACLVRMAEQHPESLVLTLDQDFRVYRKNQRQIIPTRMPKEQI